MAAVHAADRELSDAEADMTTVLVGMHRALEDIEDRVNGQFAEARELLNEAHTSHVAAKEASSLAQQSVLQVSTSTAWLTGAQRNIEERLDDRVCGIINRVDMQCTSLREQAEQGQKRVEATLAAATNAAHQRVQELEENARRRLTQEHQALADRATQVEASQKVAAQMLVDLARKTSEHEAAVADMRERTLNVARLGAALAGLALLIALAWGLR